MSKTITIIGAGISGITTALTLQLLDYETTVYAEYLVNGNAPEDPKFASLFPAASVIPHSVQSDKIDEILPVSQQVFEFLLEQNMQGMQLNRHYEIFEEEKDNPSYAPFLKNYARIDPNANDLPRRPDASMLSGWSFDCLFTEWPIYLEKLYEWYKKAGGKIIQKRITGEDISQLEGEFVINCCGIWSPDLFEDAEPKRVSRGHLLHFKDAPPFRDSSGRIPSYNYTPGKDIYCDPQGKATDVYFYPRSNGWILGGSRQPGIIDDQDNWQGKEHSDAVNIDGVELPRQIYHLNKEIIKQTYKIDIGQFSRITAKVGYRYIRTEKGQGLQLKKAEEYNRAIIHNYGHGGAGVTLSWGCAVYIAELIKKTAVNKSSLSDTASRLTDRLKQFAD